MEKANQGTPQVSKLKARISALVFAANKEEPTEYYLILRGILADARKDAIGIKETHLLRDVAREADCTPERVRAPCGVADQFTFLLEMS